MTQKATLKIPYSSCLFKEKVLNFAKNRRKGCNHHSNGVIILLKCQNGVKTKGVRTF